MHEDVIKVIMNAAPEVIVYVSCNPATQARDLAILDAKYKVTDVQLGRYVSSDTSCGECCQACSEK